MPSQQKETKNETERYMGYLRSASSRVYAGIWPVRQENGRNIISRRLFGKKRNIHVQLWPEVGKSIYALTRMVEGGRFKFAEFFVSEEESLLPGTVAHATRFVAFRREQNGNHSDWSAFWANFTNPDRFAALLHQGLISPRQVRKLFYDDYLRGKYYEQLSQLESKLIHLAKINLD
jgi:hypothetical protein